MKEEEGKKEEKEEKGKEEDGEKEEKVGEYKGMWVRRKTQIFDRSRKANVLVGKIFRPEFYMVQL